jgi:hypothetical protein
VVDVKRFCRQIKTDEVFGTHSHPFLTGAECSALNRIPKVRVAERVVRGLTCRPSVVSIQDQWQARAIELRACHVLFGCVDSFSERNQIEQFSRRFLVPYIDIGMDVHEVGNRADVEARGVSKGLLMSAHPVAL